MDERILKRKLNPFLLITTVLVLAILAGSSVFYQTELNDIVESKNQLNTQLENKTQKISSLQKTNENLSKEVSSKNTRIDRLEQTNIDKENKINNLNNEINELDSTMSNLRQEKNNMNQEISELENELEDLNFSMEIICSSNNTNSVTDDRCELNGY